ALTQITGLIASLPENDPYEATRVLNLYGSEINNWQLEMTEKIGKKSVCPECSGNGNCRVVESTGQEVCVCNDGYTLDDCSMKQADFDMIMETKLLMMQKLNDSFSRLQEQVVEPCGSGVFWMEC